MFACAICEDWVITSNLCQDCRKVKHLTTCYGKDRVLKSLERLFMRTEFQQSHKEREVLNEEKQCIEKKSERLTRSKSAKLAKSVAFEAAQAAKSK